MTEPREISLSELMIASRSIPTETRRRLLPDVYVTVPGRQVPEREAEGWVVDRQLKRSVRMRMPKPHDIAFQDRVWAAFAKLNFTLLNKDTRLALNSHTPTFESHYVEVFAADDEVVLVVLCRSTDSVRSGQFRKEVDQIQRSRAGIISQIRDEYPGRKVKFVLATNNFGVSASTADRLREAEIVHMDEDVIEYYINLADHLGRAARYQLLGNLFAGTRIPNLNPEVVAIEAHMGGHKYYSFSIEPERLLKLGYVLHRNKANTSLMPTYQRLIKKARLKSVAEFVNAGGYFPNSLILSLEASTRGLKFEPFAKHAGETRAGILHLPQTFRAAYIIDGQHRLYGYSDSSRAESDLIPVVAFINLERADQLRLFMQINENQQAVPKNLRNTLNADLLYDSKDLREQMRALKLHVAQRLGEDKASPLFGRVIIGENSKTALRCLTIDAISRGIDRGNYLGTYTKAEVKQGGSFYRGSNDSTMEPLLDFLMLGIGYVKEWLDVQFRLGSAEGGFVFINSGIESLIRILSDIVDEVQRIKRCDPRSMTAQQLFEESVPYLDALIEHLDSLESDEGLEYRRMYGVGAGSKYWRRLQVAIHSAMPGFDPPGLQEYLQDEEKQFNEESREMIAGLELFIKRDVRKRLEDELGSGWFKEGVPKKVQIESGKLMIERNAELETEEELEQWDCLYLVDYRIVMTQSQDTWRRLFEKRYTPPGDEHKAGGWRARSDWLVRLNDLRNDVFHGRTVSEDGHDFLVTLTTWLVKGQSDNDL